MATAKQKADQPGILNFFAKCHSMFKRDLKEDSFTYLLLRPCFQSEIIWGGYRRIVIFRLIRDNFNFPVFKATEQITKYIQSCLEKMRKYAPKMKEKAFLSILNQNFPEGACLQNPLAAWALRAEIHQYGYCRPSGLSTGKPFVHASLAIKPWQSIYQCKANKI